MWQKLVLGRIWVLLATLLGGGLIIATVILLKRRSTPLAESAPPQDK